jgi:tetratricopeptide (TPR) repeat protein
MIMGYRNETDRLCGIYESSGKLDDYIKANKAFEALIAGGNYTSEDMLSFARLQDSHSVYYVKKAIELYNKVIKDEETVRSHVYYNAHYQLITLLARNNRSHESIDRYKKMIKEEPTDYHAYSLLESAYFWAKQYDDAWLVLEAALKLEPNDAALLSEAGYVLKAIGRYEEAIDFFNKSFAQNPENASTLYGKACLYMDIGKYKESIKAWEDVIEWCKKHGFGEETDWPKREIEKLQKLI